MDDSQFKEELLNKIGDLTSSQKEHLAKFLSNPTEYTESTKEDIVILSDLLFNLRKSKCFKNRKVRGSTESQVYKTYGIDEGRIELDLYNHLKNFGIQLRKGGYTSPFARMDELKLSDEELFILDEIFPENSVSKEEILVIKYPDLSINELELRDIEASRRHSSLRVSGYTGINKKDKPLRIKNKSVKNKKKA